MVCQYGFYVTDGDTGLWGCGFVWLMKLFVVDENEGGAGVWLAYGISNHVIVGRKQSQRL